MTDGRAMKEGSIPDLDGWLADHHLAGSWSVESARDEAATSPVYPPYLWKWEHIHEALTRVGPTLAAHAELAERMAGYKHLSLSHPTLPPGVSPTVNVSAQVLVPGELGEARRHLQAEVGFIVQGNPGAYAVVEGERFPMEAGDLLVTPAWSWYDWANEGDEPVTWINAGDISLTRLAYRFREVHPLHRQPIDKPPGYWSQAAGQIRPVGVERQLPTPPARYPWAPTAAALAALQVSDRAPDPFDGFRLMFPHPLTGGATTPTLACEIQLLPAGFTTRAHRHTSTTRYHVVQGHGVTVVEGERLEWNMRDCFMVPPWSWHRHQSASEEDAIIFSVTDRPTMQALELYSVEPGPERSA
jgi:gentisate 1,2-dioxygenase